MQSVILMCLYRCEEDVSVQICTHLKKIITWVQQDEADYMRHEHVECKICESGKSVSPVIAPNLLLLPARIDYGKSHITGSRSFSR
jgi:hypothetical protein